MSRTAAKSSIESVPPVPQPTTPQTVALAVPVAPKLIAQSIDEARILYSDANDNNYPIEATKKIANVIDDLCKLEEVKKQLIYKEEILKLSIMNYMQLHSRLTYNNSLLATWKSCSRKNFDLAAFKQGYPSLYESFLRDTTARMFRLC